MATKIIDNMINWDESFNQTASEYIYEYGDDDDKDGGDDNGCSYYFWCWWFKVIDKNGIKSKKIRTIIQPEHFDGHGQDNYGGDNVDNDGGDNVVDDVVKCLIKMVL